MVLLAAGGKQFDYLVSERGLRQGDPLSPYLFLLCTETFSSLLQSAEQGDQLHGISIFWGAPSVSHLLFANDTFIFCQASLMSTHSIKAVLEDYCKASGQGINFLKSSVVFSKNTLEDGCLHIVLELTIRRSALFHLAKCDGGLSFVSYGVSLGTRTFSSGITLRMVYSRSGAYHLACTLEYRPCSSSLKEDEMDWWRRVCHRIPGVPGVCSVCQEVREDAMHVLAYCPFARDRWGFGSLSVFLLDYLGPITPHVPAHWQAPPSLSVKINFDGATFQQGTELGVGVVARDALRKCMGLAVPAILLKRSGNVVAHCLARIAIHFAVGDDDIPTTAATILALDIAS
ncbi:putative mitochondrial protein [Sesamum angolense]|uniref:Mitochondrial protein n=1 Tax=Sesamum angolense TaxID=2727404 RepID=A0AAE1WQW4_9LAMI|nr:putative mitochondrial protein [Sesamum angolense]